MSKLKNYTKREDLLIIKKSKINSHGVFALKDIEKNAILFGWTGGFEDPNKITKKYGKRFLDRCLEVDYWTEAVVTKGSFAWYVNHSCNPSCGIYGNSIITMKKIKKGGEITFDYSMCLATNDWLMNCKCKNSNCREVISSFFCLSKELKKKYARYASNHIKRRLGIREAPYIS